MEDSFFVAEILTKILSVSEGIVILFGSYAKETAADDSDIDVDIDIDISLSGLQMKGPLKKSNNWMMLR